MFFFAKKLKFSTPRSIDDFIHAQVSAELDPAQKERIKKRGLKTLKQSGILDSYQYLLTSLCKYGLPTGDLYEFSAL